MTLRPRYRSKFSKVYDLGADKRTFRIWRGMHDRCYNKKHISYRDYGGRGILICKRWHRSNPNGFKNFFLDMGNAPEKHSLDRVNVNGWYEKKNCRWATAKDQSRGRRKYGALTSYSMNELAIHIASLKRNEIEMLIRLIVRELR